MFLCNRGSDAIPLLLSLFALAALLSLQLSLRAISLVVSWSPATWEGHRVTDLSLQCSCGPIAVALPLWALCNYRDPL